MLVHGAFADASGWADVTTKLQRRGYTVIAPANPLRGVASDSAYLASVLATIDGPIILGRALLRRRGDHQRRHRQPQRQGARLRRRVRAGEGETSGELSTHVPRQPADRGEPRVPTLPDLADRDRPGRLHQPRSLPGRLLRRSAAPDGRRHGHRAASGLPVHPERTLRRTGWRTIPSWYLVARQDQAIPPDSQRFMAQRMKAHTREINSSHVAMISHPRAVTDMILDAARATR